MISNLLLALAIFGTLTSAVYLLLVAAGVCYFRRDVSSMPSVAFAPGVSVLKPLHGMEPGLREHLESFFLQKYPEFELIFCARHESDAGLQLARELADAYPHVSARILTCGEPPYSNAKVFSLEKMLHVAVYDVVVISDSDVCVADNYLAELVAPFADAKVGMVSCLYRGVALGGVWSTIEALGMSVEMPSGVLVARMLEGIKFALGPTMATRKSCLEAIGGLRQIGEYCADDYLLGNLIATAGYDVRISYHSIDHIIVNRSFLPSIKHQVRWMKSTRYSRPKGHFGTGLTYAVPFGLLGLLAGILAGRPWLGAALLAISIANRVAQALLVGWGVLRDRKCLQYCWLYPVRDLMGCLFWLASYSDSKILWRGHVYRLGKGGRMTPVEASAKPINSVATVK